jgi:2-phospho-L-lactate guanylyltransferase
MLGDVVAAISAAGIDPVVAVADATTEEAVRLGLASVAVAVDEPGGGLDQSVARHAAGHPDGLLVVMADLPALAADEVADLLEEDAAVTVAETEDGGTGALLRIPAAVIETSYGPGSAARHVALAESAGASAIRVRRPGFLFEIDRPADLALARRMPVGDATASVLRTLAER